MAIKTMSSSSGGNWSEGWKTVTFKNSKYGTWNETRYIDIWFDEYPDTLNMRVYEAHAKDSGEEFAIAKLFRLANAGIVGEVQDSKGKKSIQYDDDAKNLDGKQAEVFFYKNEEGCYRVLNRIAPVVQEGEVLSYNDKDVNYWKTQAEKYYNEYKKPSENGIMEMSVDEIKDQIDNKNSNDDDDDVPWK